MRRLRNKIINILNNETLKIKQMVFSHDNGMLQFCWNSYFILFMKVEHAMFFFYTLLMLFVVVIVFLVDACICKYLSLFSWFVWSYCQKWLLGKNFVLFLKFPPLSSLLLASHLQVYDPNSRKSSKEKRETRSGCDVNLSRFNDLISFTYVHWTTM